MNCPNCGTPLRADLKFCPACGTPVAPPAPPATASEPLRTSWAPSAAPAPPRKSRAGKILLVVLALFLMLAVGASFALYYGVRYYVSSVKSSEPYQIAERELHENPVARGALGGIRSVGFPIGAYGTEADGSGNAAFTMSVGGEEASGQYSVVLERSGGVWRIVQAELMMADGRVIHLVGGGTGGGGFGDGPPAPASGDTEPVTVPGAIEVGALDGKALKKPAPAYPSVARSARAAGKVVVRVTVDESGQVIMASATSGHPLLRAAAVAAARQARFSPTLKGGEPVKVIGTLTYELR